MKGVLKIDDRSGLFQRRLDRLSGHNDKPIRTVIDGGTLKREQSN